MSTPRPNCLDVTRFIKWAKGIARGVADDYGFRIGSAETHELEGVALLAIVELAKRFDMQRVPPGGDPEGAFKGYAAIEVRSRCRREAVCLRGGGTVGKGSSPHVRTLVVGGLPEGDDGDVNIACPERESDDEDDDRDELPPIACKHEPTLVITRSEESMKRNRRPAVTCPRCKVPTVSEVTRVVAANGGIRRWRKCSVCSLAFATKETATGSAYLAATALPPAHEGGMMGVSPSDGKPAECEET